MPVDTFIKSQFYTRKSPNLQKLGFDFNQPVDSEYLKIQSMLYSEYHINCESMLSIMKKFCIPSSRSMDIIFKLFDIEPRSFSEALLNGVQQGRVKIRSNIAYKNIYHKTWLGDTVLLRSSYEEEFAKYLDSKKTNYLVESLRIKYYDIQEKQYRIAVPDFYLPDTHTIVEVKSTYWLDEQNMKDKKKSYLNLGYKLNLYLDHKLITDW